MSAATNRGSNRVRTQMAAVALLLAATATGGAAAEVYRCTVDGQVTYTDRPCAGGERMGTLPADAARASDPPAGTAAATGARAAPAAGASAQPPRFDAWTTGEHPDVVRTMADLARRCGSGDTDACRTHRLNEAHYAGNRERNRRCADGDARACDEIRCLLRGDREACARVD